MPIVSLDLDGSRIKLDTSVPEPHPVVIEQCIDFLWPLVGLNFQNQSLALHPFQRHPEMDVDTQP